MAEKRKVTEADLLRGIKKMREEFQNPQPAQEQYMYVHPRDYKRLKQLMEQWRNAPQPPEPHEVEYVREQVIRSAKDDLSAAMSILEMTKLASAKHAADRIVDEHIQEAIRKLKSILAHGGA